MGRSKTKLKYVKNDHIFKATTQKKSTQCIILLLFLLFSQIKIEGVDSTPPPIKTKVKCRLSKNIFASIHKVLQKTLP